MANVNIPFSQLPVVLNLVGNEIIPLDQGGTTKTATAAQIAQAITGIFNALSAGLAPASGGGTANFLRADATWRACAQLNAGAQLGLSVQTVNAFDDTDTAASTAFVQRAIRASMATIPLSGMTGGTYSFASKGTAGELDITAVGGAITSIANLTAGTGWKVGDLFTVGPFNTGNGDAILRVLTLSGSTPATAEILYGGTGYSTTHQNFFAPQVLSSFSLTLSGLLTSPAVFVMPNGTYLTQSDQWIVNNNTAGSFSTTFKISDGTDTATGTGVIVPQGANNSAATLLQTDGVNDIWQGVGAVTQIGEITTTPLSVNVGVAGDNAISLPLPGGFSRVGSVQVILSGASGNISTGDFGLFTQAGGAGTAVITAGQAITIVTNANNTNNNMQTVNQVNFGTESFLMVPPRMFFRVGTTVAGTVNVQIVFRPLL